MRDSIHVKLVVFSTILIAGIVGFLTFQFRTQQLAALDEGQRTRVATYGDLLSDQLRSAIGFSDQETAREVMSALEADPDVIAAALFDSNGEALVLEGKPSPWVTRARQGVQSKRVFAANGRVAVVAPVRSREGPEGTLVIELSRARILARQRATIRTAIGVAVVVILVGLLVSTLVARRLVGRLRAIGDVASDIAAGSLRVNSVPIDTLDEIGVLASAFNAMVAQLEDEQRRLRETVQDLRLAEDGLADSNRELESRVEQRTLELRTAYERVEAEMTRRGQLEIELRQAQKLEAVGRLAAGVAHEINTPIQFVSNSVDFIRNASLALLELIDTQQQLIEVTEPAGLAQCKVDARLALEAADLGFIREELPHALDRTVDGLDRVAVIVRSMKVFSHQGSAMAPVDLNKAIASTLTIAHHEYKTIADVETSYGELPPVVCESGEINQVILNLVLNASHAIADVVEKTSIRGTLRVRTWLEGERACISIGDTGGGIPDAVRDRIYDPFFTTKDVGKGTGQGLAIARSVVEKHGGTIAFETELGAGTEFVLRLPLTQQLAKLAA